MPPKGHRAPALVRAHSRSSSATKLPINLQFTQKKALPRTKQPPPPGPKPRAGFHIASPGDEEEEEEDWVSSESGAVTPNLQHNDNDDSDLDSGESNERQPAADLQRVATARLSDYYVAAPEVQPTKRTLERVATATAAPRPPATTNDTVRPPATTTDTARPPATTNNTTRPPPTDSRGARLQMDTRPPAIGTVNDRTIHDIWPDSPSTPLVETAPPSQAPSPSRRRHSRPMSTHSVAKSELRPHPLIRGQSFGQPNHAPKPSPVLPVAVTRDTQVAGQLSTSPTPSSPTAPFPAALTRRTSVSSARSVATVGTPHPPPRSVREVRNRTFSTLSAASSSAALSSLTHLPTVSRPPTPQMIAYFPPLNPHVHLDAIHPLLPPPYVHNHLTVLARRTPIREAFDRVVRARQTARV
ncbi:hypothetical protein C8R44DRAFT_734290 [Mycena epipterygia]|nr:hypothetical protein C8R44DRAFT_734290 [Mycena epipterygia]